MAINLDKLKRLFIVVEEENADATADEKDSTGSVVDKLKGDNKKKYEEEKKSAVKWKAKSMDNSQNNSSDSEQINNTDEKSVTLNQKIFDQLITAIHSANLQGEDYLEFYEALQAMKDLPLEEELKFKTVFATLSPKGLTKEKVLESADYYLKILENEKTKFYEAIKIKRQSDITKKQKEIEAIKKEIDKKAAEIEKLTQEINLKNDEVAKLNNDIATAENKIKRTEKEFLYTFNKVRDTIKNTLNKIKKYNP